MASRSAATSFISVATHTKVLVISGQAFSMDLDKEALVTDAVVVLTQRLQNSSAMASLHLPLTAEERTVMRGRRTTSCGRPVLLQLPRGGSLQPGDLLGDQSGSTVVEVMAAPEALLRVQGSHPLELLQAAYHLGNRHVALELHEQELLLPEDSVLATMLEGRGLTVSRCLQPFAPEGGAYGGHQHG